MGKPAAAREPVEEPGPGQGVVPVPREQPGDRGRLGGTSKTTHGDGPHRRTPVVRNASIRSRDKPVVRPKPAPDIDGRLVTEHELVRYDTSRPGSPEVRWELATVTRMTKGLQVKNLTYYNVRLNGDNRISKSVELLPDGTWQVWRGDRWWPPDREKPDVQGQPHLYPEERGFNVLSRHGGCRHQDREGRGRTWGWRAEQGEKAKRDSASPCDSRCTRAA